MSNFPIRNLNRVENIKKKFELNEEKNVETNDFRFSKNARKNEDNNEDKKKKEMIERRNLTFATSHNNEEINQLILQNTKLNQNTKLGVKRSLAFRCDRKVCGKNVLNVTRSRNNNEADSHLNDDKKEGKVNGPDTARTPIEIVNKVARSGNCTDTAIAGSTKTNTSHLVAQQIKNLSTRLSQGEMNNPIDKDIISVVDKRQMTGSKPIVKSKILSKKKDILGSPEPAGSQSSSFTGEPVVTEPSYSVVDKSKKKKDMSENKIDVNLKPTDSIKLYLSSPLPSGPPPKKPPRTFAHTPQPLKLDQGTEDVDKTKIDSRLKLEKLENLFLNHQKSGHIIVPSTKLTPGDDGLSVVNNFPEARTQTDKKLTDTKLQTDNNFGTCLKTLNCTQTHSRRNSGSYNKDMSNEVHCSNIKANLMTDLHKKLSVTSSTSGKTKMKHTKETKDSCHNNCHDNTSQNKPADKSMNKIKKQTNLEHIYDVPFKTSTSDNVSSVFTTFGKNMNENKKDTRRSVKKVKSEGDGDLHYMCTKIVESSVKCDQHTTHFNKSNQKDFVQNNREHINDNFDMKMLPGNFKYDFYTAENHNKLIQKADINDNSDHVDSFTKTVLRPFNLRLHLSRNSRRSGSDTSSVVSESDSASIPSTPEEGRSLENIDVLQHDKQNGGSSKEIYDIKDNLLNLQTAKRKGYLQRVSSRYFCHDASLQFQNKNSTFTHLFESCLLVGLTLSEDDINDLNEFGKRTKIPYIKSKYPPDAAVPPLIESFCFPDANDWPPPSDDQKPEEQYFSIVFTNENGERKFGYCRRVLPEGGHFCLPLAYCVISPYRAHGFYYKVLKELESRHGSPESHNFVKQLYDCEFPNPGESLKLNQILEEASFNNSIIDSSYSTTLVSRPSDVRLEERDLTQLLETLKLPVFLKLFSSLLLERKVLLLSSSLRTLSCCIEALQSILYPFSWQHCYIPVLPAYLVEICEAPTPYIIGLLKAKEETNVVANLLADEGIIVDLDDSKILYSCKDEASILPSQVRKSLKSKLSSISNEENEGSRNVKISEAFIKLFVDLCGHYPNFIFHDVEGKKVFQKDMFIRYAASRDIQSFLEWFTETAMFHAFVEETLQSSNDGAFEKNWPVLHKPEKLKKTRTLGERFKEFAPFK